MESSTAVGHVAVVTGAARGIGAAVATGLAEAGYQVIVADLHLAEALETAAGLSRLGHSAAARELDVRDWPQTRQVLEAVAGEYGRLDVLVANAGVGSYGDVTTGDPDHWRVVVETNLLGAMHCARAALPAMQAQGSGDIVLMASVAGRKTWAGEPIYISTKWGLVGFGWALRKELLDAGIRVSMIEPGMVDTPLVRSTADGRAELDRYAALQPDDVARAVVYAVTQPRHMSVSEIMVLPVGPEL